MRYLALAVLTLALGLPACDAPVPTQVAPELDPPLFSLAAETCGNIAGTVTAQFVQGEDWDIEGTLFDGDGVAVGDAFAWIDGLEPRGDGAIETRMRHRYVIDGSSLDTEDRGVLSPAEPPVYRFNNRLEVVGGTGAFSEAGGMIRSHGTVDLVGGSIQLAYHGRVCP
ncbi:MAG: hypothetical protein EA351_14090 [Gemmatimonadales bacterium]|nr:MAG: hypothetical protein EA351_14090 [Gemmatimonadales bacterium]